MTTVKETKSTTRRSVRTSGIQNVITAANAKQIRARLERRVTSLEAQIERVDNQLLALSRALSHYGWDQRVVEMAKAFDKLGFPVNITQREAKPKARAAGLRGSNEVMTAALKFRRELAAVNR